MDRTEHTATGADEPAFTALWQAHRRRMLDLAFRMLLDLRRRRGRRAGSLRSTGPRRHRPHRRPGGMAGGRDQPVVPRPAADAVDGTRPSPLDDAGDPFDPHALDPSDQRHPRRQRHPGDARPARTAEPGGADVVRAARRVPVLLRRGRDHRRAQPRRRAVNWRVGPAGRCRPSRRRAGSPSTPRSSRQLSERFIEACTGGDLEGLLALLDPAVDGAGDIVPDVVVGAADVAPGILRYLGPPASPRCCTCPSVIGSASSRCATVACSRSCCLTIDERSRRPRRRLGGSRPARGRERGARPRLTRRRCRRSDGVRTIAR